MSINLYIIKSYIYLDGNIILWQQSEQKEVLFGEEEDNFNKETWRIVSMLR